MKTKNEQQFLIVGIVSTEEEAEEIESIARAFVVGNRIREISQN